MRIVLLTDLVAGTLALSFALAAPAVAATSKAQAEKECRAQYSTLAAYNARTRTGQTLAQQVAACVKAKTGG